MTLVSVITPSLNQARFLRQTLDSVLGQDYPEIEYIVVDGGSSDGSVEIIREYAPRLAWWVSEPDRGQADAINKGIAQAHGTIAAWLNSDDLYLPGAIAAAAHLFDIHPDAAMIYGDMQAIDQNGELINLLSYDQVTLDDLLCFNILGQPAVFMRREALAAVGGLDARLHLLLDHQLWLRLATQGKVVHARGIWAAARYHSGAKNISRARLFGSEAFQILQWAGAEPRLAPALQRVRNRAFAAANRVNARYLVDAGLPWDALRAWFKAFWLHPMTGLSRINLLASALLEILGLGFIRHAILRRRKSALGR